MSDDAYADMLLVQADASTREILDRAEKIVTDKFGIHDRSFVMLAATMQVLASEMRRLDEDAHHD